jgi:hypothetical protein
MGRRELAQHRPSDGVLCPDRYAHQEANGEQEHGSVDEELHGRRDREERDVDHEQRLAAELVPGPAAER